MFRAYFFHGLESTLPSLKVDYLRSVGWQVECFKIEYATGIFYEKSKKSIIDFKPDILIGSSMGGLICKFIASEFNIPMILMNPALLRQQLPNSDFPNKLGNFRPNTWALLGKEDDIVPVQENQRELSHFNAVISIGNHGHRTPNDIFEDYIQSISEELRQKINS